MMKRSIVQDITIKNIYASINGALKYTKLLMEMKTDNSTIVGDFNTPLSIMYRTIRQKINTEIDDLNNTTNQPDLTDFYRALHPTTEYTFSST